MSYLGKAIPVIMGLVTAVSCKEQEKKAKPNFLLIIADDLGWTDLGCYGSTFYETPNLDKLASQGVRFTNGYASCPVCSPTRASIQTGKYPNSTGITDWIPGRASYKKPSVTDRWLAAENKTELDHDEITIAETLKENGYRTFFAGKWHLGQTEEFWPEYQGYEINKGGWKLGYPNYWDSEAEGYFSPYGNPRLEDGPPGEYLPERLTDETINFIEDNKDKPFFICMSYYLVHTPLMAKEEIIEKYKRKRESLSIDPDKELIEDPIWEKYATESSSYKERIIQGHAVYAAMVEALDQNVGRLLDKLEELELNNTIVIFVSDNGGLSTAEGSPTCNYPLRAGKGWLYEGGIRVPFIIKTHDEKNAGLVHDMPVATIDIFPTILSYAKINMDKLLLSEKIDGINLRPYLQKKKLPDRPLYWHYPHYSNQGGNPGSVIRLGNYKLISDIETGKVELYNLAEDIQEAKDITEEYPEIKTMLYEKLENWKKDINAKEMMPNPVFLNTDK
jgi:arylsulfatase A-like enzyme